MPDYKLAARRAAQKYHIDPAIFQAMIQQESGFNPNARSGAGAQGIAQFMPATAKGYGVNLHDNRVTDDLEGAAKYIANNLRSTGGNYHQALSIYNSGRPDAYKDPRFAGGQTYNYVKTILAGARNFSGARGGGSAAEGAPSVSTLGPPSATETTHSFDQTGYDKARGLAVLGQRLAKHNPNNPLLRRGVVGTQAPDISQFEHTNLETLTGPKLAQGIAARGYSPESAALIQTVTDRINKVSAQKLPYAWGGGHGAKPQTPGDGVAVDCSGFVSSVLGINPRVSGAMGSVGKPGRGRVNIYYNGEHTLMEVNGHFAGTSATNPGGGAGWIPRSAISPQYLKRFQVRHLD
jgi:hypothetical protein